MNHDARHSAAPEGGAPQPDEDEFWTQEFWDGRYREREALWSGAPNRVLVDEAGPLPPGRALDVGAGEGGDAVWLAARGWQVTAADVSAVGLERTAAQVRAAGDLPGSVTTWQVDLLATAPEPRSYDLVSAFFFHLPARHRDRVFAGLAEAVAPGGTLLIVGHPESHLRAHAEAAGEEVDASRLDGLFTADQVAAGLDPGSWEIGTAEERRRDAGPAASDLPGHDHADIVLRARRTA